MDGEQRIERRRVPRCQVREDVDCRLEVRARVRMVDISASGALLVTETLLPAGSSAHLKSGMGATAFAPDVQIRRVASVTAVNGLGVSFGSMDDRSRRSLEAFLKKASA